MIRIDKRLPGALCLSHPNEVFGWQQTLPGAFQDAVRSQDREIWQKSEEVLPKWGSHWKNRDALCPVIGWGEKKACECFYAQTKNF